MKAISQEVYGSADVLEYTDIDKPEIGDDEVLVRVLAAGVDRGAWHLMTGRPYLMRIMGFGFRAPKVRVRGREVAGFVEAVGKDVTTFKPGDEVFGIAEGSFAEYAPARADKLAPKPEHLTFEQAAAVPISGITALQALRKGEIRAGQSVLIIGASGGVGSYAVQLAKAFGADVTGVASTTKVDLVRSLGADRVIDYKREDFAGDGNRYDLIIDIGGNRPLSHLRRALTPNGTLVIVGGEAGGGVLGGLERNLHAVLLTRFVGQNLRALTAKENGEDLVALAELLETGKIAPAVDRTFPLSEAPKAMRYLEEGHARGKLVICVS